MITEYEKFSDKELLDLYRGGDQWAFEEINERYKNVVRYHARFYYLTGGDVMGVYGSYDRALEDAKELARSKAEERARMQTPEGDLKTEFDVREDFFRLPAGDKVLVKTEVTASVQIII